MQKGSGVKKTGIGTTSNLPSGASSGGGGQYSFLPKAKAGKNGVTSTTDILKNPVIPSEPKKSPIR